MTPRRLRGLFAKLVADSEREDDWARANRLFRARVAGFDCDARLRVHLIAQEIGGRDRVTGEIRLELLNVGGLPGAESSAWLHFGVFKSEFSNLASLYEATFAAAEGRLASNEAFQALAERKELGRAIASAPSATVVVRSRSL